MKPKTARILYYILLVAIILFIIALIYLRKWDRLFIFTITFFIGYFINEFIDI